MATFNIHAAKTQLSRLVEQAAAGEEIIIAKAGTPIAKLVPFTPAERKERSIGTLAGKMIIPEDFDAPLPDDLLNLFEGN
jgi:prevent-host-death family protein